MPEELSILSEADQEDFEVKKILPTDAYLDKIRAVIAFIFILTP